MSIANCRSYIIKCSQFNHYPVLLMLTYFFQHFFKYPESAFHPHCKNAEYSYFIFEMLFLLQVWNFSSPESAEVRECKSDKARIIHD
jgi:hypothetical protein